MFSNKQSSPVIFSIVCFCSVLYMCVIKVFPSAHILHFVEPPPSILCPVNTQYVCEGSSHFRTCGSEGGVASSVFACSVLQEARDTDVCYSIPEVRSRVPCGPPPPVCKGPHILPIPGRCSNYVMCNFMGGHVFVRYIAECAEGLEFSVTESRCLPASLANCSIPLPHRT